ncbi:17043_t:CDS:1, partial [Gigaspora rosea]
SHRDWLIARSSDDENDLIQDVGNCDLQYCHVSDMNNNHESESRVVKQRIMKAMKQQIMKVIEMS